MVRPGSNPLARSRSIRPLTPSSSSFTELNWKMATRGMPELPAPRFLASEISRKTEVARISSRPSHMRRRTLNIHALQHLGRALVQELRTAQLFETVEQLGGA